MAIDFGKIGPRKTVETTFGDLRPTDQIIDKSDQAWPLAELVIGPHTSVFWLCDPVTKIKLHALAKPLTDPVKVSRIELHADELIKLEEKIPETLAEAGVEKVDEAEAVEGVKQILAATVEAEVTAEEENAAAIAAATDEPITLPLFEKMTDLEMRNHLYLLHGVFATDVQSRDQLGEMHTKCHAGKVTAKQIPHHHSAEVK